MRFFGKSTITGYYPVDTREEALTVVQKNLFRFTHGVVGTAVYLYTSQRLAFALGPWVVYCNVEFNNMAALSMHSGEFDELFGIPYNSKVMSWESYNFQQRNAILWAGYDGFLLDNSLIAVFGQNPIINAVKASPKPDDPRRSASYKTIWKKIKRISKVFEFKSKSKYP